MEARKTVAGDTFIVELTRKKRGFFNYFFRVISFCFGLCGALLSIVLMFTIIGIIPGIMMMMGSVFFMALGLGYESAICPNCGKKQVVQKHAENFTCSKCKKLTVIEWKK